MFMQLILAAGIPALPMVVGFVAGVLKDGSPLHREWWT